MAIIPQNNSNMMSLTGYLFATNIFSSSQIGNLMSFAKTQVDKQPLKKQIENAKKNEQKIFDILKKQGITSIEELNLRLKEYESAVCPLSGPVLQQAFIGAIQNVSGYSVEDIEKLQKILSKETRAILPEVMDTQQIVNTVINEMHTELGGKRELKVQTKVRTSSNNKQFIKLSDFTQVQRRAIENAIDTYNRDKRRTPIEKKTFQVDNSQSNNEIESVFKWQEVTDFVKPSEAKNFDTKKIGQINSRIAAEIKSKCPDKLIGKIINHILSRDKLAFFVGDNTKDITGILGEIKAMYYLGKFFGEDQIGNTIIWRGGLHEGADGKKPHQDIILNGLGVQVKNTTLSVDSFFSSYFANASLETILNSLPDQSLALIFKQFYGTLAFNIPYYITKGGSARAGSYHSKTTQMNSFLKRRESLLNLVEQMEKIIASFASTLMYLTSDVVEKQTLTDTNSLFFVGGKTFVLVSEILTDIQKQIDQQIEEEKTKSIHIGYKAKQTIVTAYNDGETSKSLSDVAQQVQLTSSYRFKIAK